MMSTLIRRWKVNMNVLFAFWGHENLCKQAVATDSEEAALYNRPRLFILIIFPIYCGGIVILDLMTLLVNFDECKL